ncbi:hypothetical protein N0V88_000742 [Collariella sp. IMI 366227]|nr:hypothetical protein N0V88_000742 [Collariella sp. IMI 366227]
MADDYFIINLDQEIFTIDYGAHFKLDDIPRTYCLGHMAVRSSAQPSEITEKGHKTGPALSLPEPVEEIDYSSRTVAARVEITDPRKH